MRVYGGDVIGKRVKYGRPIGDLMRTNQRAPTLAVRHESMEGPYVNTMKRITHSGE